MKWWPLDSRPSARPQVHCGIIALLNTGLSTHHDFRVFVWFSVLFTAYWMGGTMWGGLLCTLMSNRELPSLLLRGANHACISFCRSGGSHSFGVPRQMSIEFAFSLWANLLVNSDYTWYTCNICVSSLVWLQFCIKGFTNTICILTCRFWCYGFLVGIYEFVFRSLRDDPVKELTIMDWFVPFASSIWAFFLFDIRSP